jgi:hypothetical protein
LCRSQALFCSPSGSSSVVVIVFEQALAVVRFEHLRNERPDVINMGTASIKSFVVCEGVPQKLVNENSGQIVDVFVFVVRFDRLDDPVALGRNLTITLTTAQLLIDKRIDDAADRVPLPAFLFYEASAGSRPRRPAQLHEDYTALARATPSKHVDYLQKNKRTAENYQSEK